jgi:hypothetical protein
MFNFAPSLMKRGCLLAFLALVLLCGCGSLATPQASYTPTPTAAVSHTPTPTAQIAFTSYVGKWEVHDSLLSINANHTGLDQWNVGPCSESTTQVMMCDGRAIVAFTENANGSITGTIQSISYNQWNGGPPPAGFQPNAADPRTGDTFQLQHSGVHLLYTTWFGRLSDLNQTNRYWCDAYALASGWNQCGV